MEEAPRNQICLRMIPPAYKIMTGLVTKFKQSGTRTFTNSSLIAMMLLQHGKEYLKLSESEIKDLHRQYCELQEK